MSEKDRISKLNVEFRRDSIGGEGYYVCNVCGDSLHPKPWFDGDTWFQKRDAFIKQHSHEAKVLK